MLLPTKKILMVVAPAEFRDEELFVPRRIFESQGAQVTVASSKTGQARGMLGGLAVATRTLDVCRAAEFDAVLVVGGDGAATHLWPHAGAQALVRDAAELGKIVGAICLGPVVLARAGLLRGARVAVWPSANAQEEVCRAGGQLTDDELAVHGRIVTARGPEAALRWAEAVVKSLLA